MDHPNIAHFLDVGETAEGRPYFVMELVKGMPITQYCREKKLPAEARIALFIQVCRAIQHAHVKGIIHRDLKPSNILITLQDGQAIPKVIDFGIAKAMDQRLTDKTLFTRFEHMLGTPAYMSPEQVALSAVDVDTRSDVYALGVLLYELLTGTAPFDAETLRNAAAEEMRRMIREDEPPKPSTRLTQLKSAAELPDENITLRPSDIARDLDWIVMKAMEKDRGRRYDTANDLARDIERFVKNEPVEAGAPGIAYRARKFMRRHRLGVLTGAAIFAAIALGTALAIAGFLEARRERALAVEAQTKAENAQAETKREAAISEAVSAFLSQDLLAQANPYHLPGNEEVSLMEVLDRAAAKVDESFADQPEVRASLHHTLAETYNGLGKKEVALKHAREAATTFESVHGFHHARTLASHSFLASILADTDLEASLELQEKVRDGRRQTLGAEAPPTLRTMSRIASLFGAMGDNEKSVAELRKVLAIQQRVLGAEHEDAISTQQDLVSRLFETRIPARQEEAIGLARDLLAHLDDCCGEDHPKRLLALHSLASKLTLSGNPAEAEPLLREGLEKERKIFGEDHPTIMDTKGTLGQALADLGRYDEAIPLLEECLQSALDRYGEDHHTTLVRMNDLGRIYIMTENYPKAIDRLKKVLELAPKYFGPDHPNMLAVMTSLATAYSAAGQHDAALKTVESLLEKSRKTFGPEHPQTLEFTAHSAFRLNDAGRHQEAEDRMRQVCETAAKVIGADHLETAGYLSKMGDLLFEGPTWAERYAELATLYGKAFEIRRKHLGEDHPLTRDSRISWIACRKHAGESITAEEQAIIKEGFHQLTEEQQALAREGWHQLRQERKDKTKD
jgi:tetratricopeptide (TPR) repeat protein